MTPMMMRRASQKRKKRGRRGNADVLREIRRNTNPEETGTENKENPISNYPAGVRI